MTSQAILAIHAEKINKCFQQWYNQWGCCLKSQELW